MDSPNTIDTCSICYSEEPWLLSCTHHVCRECHEQLLRQGDGSVKCPVCRTHNVSVVQPRRTARRVIAPESMSLAQLFGRSELVSPLTDLEQAALDDIFAIQERNKLALYSYQARGLFWARRLETMGSGGILADEMGMGKTRQMVAILAATLKPTVILVPNLALLESWKRELNHVGTLDVRVLHSSAGFKNNSGIITVNTNSVFVASTQGFATLTAGSLANAAIDRLVIDEFHESGCAILARGVRYQSYKRFLDRTHAILWLLSGTAIKESRHLSHIRNLVVPPDLQDTVGINYFMKRTKFVQGTGIDSALPELVEMTITGCMTAQERGAHENVDPSLHPFAKLARRNKIESAACARIGLKIVEAIINGPQSYSPGDLQAFGPYMARLHSGPQNGQVMGGSNSRIVLFAAKSSIIQLSHLLSVQLPSAKVYELHGDVSVSSRPAMVDDFNRDDSEQARIMLISSMMPGGLNLQTADTVLVLDRHWRADREVQSIARIRRMNSEHLFNVVYRVELTDEIPQVRDRMQSVSQFHQGNTNATLEPFTTTARPLDSRRELTHVTEIRFRDGDREGIYHTNATCEGVAERVDRQDCLDEHLVVCARCAPDSLEDQIFSVPSQQNSAPETVYRVPNRKIYHVSERCGGRVLNVQPFPETEAIEKGWRRCLRCNWTGAAASTDTRRVEPAEMRSSTQHNQ